MTIAQLETFLAVVRTGSVRAAAASRVVSEPAVSAAVAALERELGAPLVERSGRGLRLTPAGDALARYAGEALGLLRQARSEVEAAARPGYGRLRIAAVTTAGEYVLPAILTAFRTRQPDIELALEVGNRSSVLARLRAREVDVGIGGRPPEGGGIAAEEVLPNDLVLVAARGHPLTRQRKVLEAALERETWLLREEGSGTRATTIGFFTSLGIDPPQRLTLGSNVAVKEGAVAGLGVTLLSTHAAAHELRTGLLRRIEARGLPLRRPWYLLYLRASGAAAQGGSAERSLSTPARAFAEFLRGRARRSRMDQMHRN